MKTSATKAIHIALNPIRSISLSCHRKSLSTSRSSILGFNSINGGGFMPTKFSSGVPRDSIGKRNLSLLVRDDERMKMCGKALGVSW